MLALGRQAGSISSDSSRIEEDIGFLHCRQSIHLRVGEAELQVNIVGSLFAARRWRALFDRGLEGDEVASDWRLLGVLLMLLKIAHDLGSFGVVAFWSLSIGLR